MENVCIVKGCTSDHETPGVELFHLPIHNSSIAEQWLINMRRDDLRKQMRLRFAFAVCSKHFSPRQYSQSTRYTRPRLSPSSVPDILDPSNPVPIDTSIITSQKPGIVKSVGGVSGTTSTIVRNYVAKPAQSADSQQARSVNLPAKAPVNLSDITQKKVIRLQLPPGMSAIDFANPEALKKITSQVSGIIGKTNSLKSFTVKLPDQKASSSGTSETEREDDSESPSKRSLEDTDSSQRIITKRVKLDSNNQILECEDQISESDSKVIHLENFPVLQRASKRIADKDSVHKISVDQKLYMRRMYRDKLLAKVEKQKSMLLKRGKELCKYRLLLKKLRQEKSRVPQMTMPECLRVLKGNMYDHALELLYTQLASEPRVDDPHMDMDDEDADEPSDSGEVVYTPKVLESALLFSVAGRKAYKALCETVKLPSYSDIIKWKRIIRSNPQYYKKLFPHLRAKFFKKRAPEVVGESSNSLVEGIHVKSEEPHRNDGGGLRGEVEKTVPPEEAEYLYNKLMAEKDKFDVLLSEESSLYSNNCNKLIKEHESKLNVLMSDKVIDINFDLDAPAFIEEIKKLEKPYLSMAASDFDEWDRGGEVEYSAPPVEQIETHELAPNNPHVASAIDNVLKKNIHEQVTYIDETNNTAPLFVAEDASQDQIIIKAGDHEIPVSSTDFMVTTDGGIQQAHIMHTQQFMALTEQDDVGTLQPDMPRIY